MNKTPEEILKIIENILYWDTCPHGYKVKLSKYFSLEYEGSEEENE